MNEWILVELVCPTTDRARVRSHTTWFQPWIYRCIDQHQCVRADTAQQELQKMLQARCTRRHDYADRLHVRAAAHHLDAW